MNFHTWQVRGKSETHEYNVYMKPASYATLTPTRVNTDSCLIRLVNTCEDSSKACGRPSIKATFMPVLDPLQTPISSLELDWETLDLKGRSNLVVGKPWAPRGLYAFLPENIWNPVICEMYLVVPRDAEVHLFVHKATIVAKNVELKSLSVQGDFVLDSRPEHLEFLSNNLSISDTLLIASSMGRIGLHDLNIGSQANVTVSAIDGSIDITSLAAPNLEIQSVNKAVCLVGPMASLNTSSRPFNNATSTVYSSSWDCPNTTQVPCAKPSMKLVSTGRGAVAFHALSVDINGARSEVPQPASRSNMSGSTIFAGMV